MCFCKVKGGNFCNIFSLASFLAPDKGGKNQKCKLPHRKRKNWLGSGHQIWTWWLETTEAVLILNKRTGGYENK